MQRIAILGSTGSIGVQTLNVIREHKDIFCAVALTARNNFELLYKQAKEFLPVYVTFTEYKPSIEEIELFTKLGVKVIREDNPLDIIAGLSEVDTVVYSTMGFSCLRAVLIGIENKKRICLANKETLVAGGQLVMDCAKNNGVTILPIDSEHSAIFQCLMGNESNVVNRIIITASGGAFRDFSDEQLKKVTASDALKHPNWNMGKKITIDCATLMNKGLEVIEAKWLFGLPLEKIEYVIHKESIIHSMVEFADGSTLAQMGYPSMEIPIQFSLTFPNRIATTQGSLDFAKLGSLTFKKLQREKYGCFDLCLYAIENGGLYPVILNGANEVLVEKFLKDEIKFLDIPKYLKICMEKVPNGNCDSVQAIIEKDKEVRRIMYELI